MPSQKELRAAMSKKLQEAIKHPDPTVAAGRKSAIKRWVGVLYDNFMEHIRYFKGDKLKFLHNVFQDEGCWSGVRLDNAALGQRFTEEKIGGVDNPLSDYDIACRYCVVDKIPSLFKEQFDTYKGSFSSNAVDGNGRPVKDDNKYILNSLLYGMKREDPVLSFWIDRESGELKQYDALEGFDSAVKLKWSEGVEYFYNLLKEEDKEKKLTEAIIALSRLQSVEKDAPILDFCARSMADKDTLLQKLLQKDKGVYFLLTGLIESCFFDTVHDLVQCWFYKGVSEHGDGDRSEKMLSYEEYKLLLSALSYVMLDNPELNAQARSIIMEMWRCDRFYKHKEAAVDTSNFQVPIENALAGLVVNWERFGRKSDEKKEILEIMLFAKDRFPKKFYSFEEVMIDDLRLCGREGKKKGMDYGKLAEELFSELEEPTLPTGPGGDGPCSNLRSRSKAHGSKGRTLPVDDSPQSELGTPSVSGVSDSHKKKSIFTLSGSLSNK
ncbi:MULTISPECIES: cytoplasmic incompatibility factor CifA [Wolbachia]|uniref:cytoplasmic incompatibility factor CifA n=1 Tax=Wolbachia TaxID=953 RepID=UPI0015F9B2F9|nr:MULTISPECIES: cytoplasmic incompatibility factor CifA [Wolbachia]MBA8757168.1 cytoplasmic incompatibility factor CifA [Wolbachia pipientis]MDE5058526.1 cytoplasmic incompatibility factor CifA [Wolbachia endosymbiont of Drosophila baimaii]